jgi:hypothetical protein
MFSTYRCLRVKDVKKPLASRCNKQLAKNGILCQACYTDAKKGKIPVLMCNDVTKMFGVQFHNQVFVYIDMSETAEVKAEMSMADVKLKLRNELDLMDKSELFEFAVSCEISLKKSELNNDVKRKNVVDEIVKKLTVAK